VPEPELTALVIGNAAYTNVERLENPVNDAEDMTVKLTELGFTVQTLKDATRVALVGFETALLSSSVGLLFFAGHAFQIDGRNYLAGIDTAVGSPLAVSLSALHLDFVLSAMKSGAVRTGLVILDACRNNPFEGLARSVASNELATVFAPKGTLIAFSTSPGQKAGDGTGGRNGYYTQALLHHIDAPNVLIETMFKRVRSTLEAITNGGQTSWEHTSLTGDFRFQRRTVSGINGYGPMALSDSLFPRGRNAAGTLIEALKSKNWDTQNPALAAFSQIDASACTTDELFVIGRNIYQAACGSSYGAIDYIDEFKDRTSELEVTQRKAILDGMLYEIFFDSAGQHRARLKLGEFARVFELAGDGDFRSSLSFLGNCLEPYADRYHVMPGRLDVVNVTLTADPPRADGKRPVTGIWLDSTNIFRELEDDGDGIFFGLRSSNELNFTGLREYLSQQLIIPPNLLHIDAPTPFTAATTWIFPPNRTLSKT
jgi:hypothetical protein